VGAARVVNSKDKHLINVYIGYDGGVDKKVIVGIWIRNTVEFCQIIWQPLAQMKKVQLDSLLS
jgi:hypothetical protein